MADGVCDAKNYMIENGLFQGFQRFTWRVETAFSEGLTYHKDFMDLNSAVQNNIGTMLIDKGDTKVIKSKTEYLAYLRGKMDTNTLQKMAENVAQLSKAAEKNGAEFLYVMAPVKGYNMEFPENITDYNKANCDAFLEELKKAGVPYYSLISEMESQNISEEEMFFITDHHWKPEYALWAANAVSEELERRFGFKYDKEKLDIENYNIEVYNNWFLGSQGKKTGQYFSSLGVDDISIITPKFKTYFNNTLVGKDYSSQGSFEEVLIHKAHIETKDFYNKNPYSAYLGGDYREEIIENILNKDAKSVLILKDSFSCAFAPFFAMTNSVTYLLDMRDFDEFAGERIDVEKYIEKIKPDAVMIMYTGVTSDYAMYNFGEKIE